MINPKLSLIHPTSNPNSRNAAIALAEAGLLHEIITTTAYNPEGTFSHILNYLPKSLSYPIHQELKRRIWVAPTGARMRSYPWQETLRVGLTKTGISRRLGIREQRLVDWVYTSLDRQVANHHLNGITAVYAYEDGAATTFAAAKERGIRCFYDLPIVFYRTSRAIQAEEAERFPALASALQSIQEPTQKLLRKEQEVSLADHIFVASSVTQRSLLEIGVPANKISVIPYGAPISYFQPQPKPDSKFRALFVGRVGPRKGVHYLLNAWQKLELPETEAELVMVGINEFSSDWLTPYQNTFRYVPSVPHAALNDYYSSASVLVFPSLVEGFGLVLLEAMACGIPVITTPNTAGPDILTDGVEGFIIPIRSTEILQEKLEWCYSHPEELAEMGRAARRKAECLSWELYRQTLINQVQILLRNYSR